MSRFLTMRRLGILYCSLFALSLAGVWAHDYFVRKPGRECEESGRWWDPESRICAKPISIAEITGRRNGESREEASRRLNRELVDIEHRLAAADRARAEDARIQRERLNAARN